MISKDWKWKSRGIIAVQNTQPNCVVYRSITAVLTIVAVTIYCLLCTQLLVLVTLVTCLFLAG